MANLAKSDATWELFWDRFLAIVGLGGWALAIRDRLTGSAVKIVEEGDADSNTGGTITLAGVRPRLAATEENKLYVRVTGASNPYTVSLYKATGGGGGDLVAQGSGNAGTTITLAEQNSSGVSGTYPLADPATADTSDAHILTVYTDWREHFRLLFDSTDPEGEDQESLQAIRDGLSRMATQASSMVAEAVGIMRAVMVADPANANDRAYGSKYMAEAFASLLSEVAQDDGSGAISRARSGALEALRQAMVDEATGSTQSVVRRLVAAAAGVAGTSNDGAGAIASHTPEAHCPVGVRTLACVAGLGTGDGGSEEFEVSFASSEDDRTRVYDRRLTVGQSYKGPDGFGGANGITLTRTITKTGDNSHLHLSNPASGWSSSGESETNTAAGVLNWKIVADGSNWIVEFYRTANMASGDLVARSSAVAAAAAFVATQKNTSGIQISGSIGSAPVNGTTGTINLNFFRVQNAAGRPDSFTVAVTLTSEGLISRVLARLPILGGYGYRLNGVASSSELIGDGRARANTLPRYQDETA